MGNKIQRQLGQNVTMLGQGFSRPVDPLPKGFDPTMVPKKHGIDVKKMINSEVACSSTIPNGIVHRLSADRVDHFIAICGLSC